MLEYVLKTGIRRDKNTGNNVVVPSMYPVASTELHVWDSMFYLTPSYKFNILFEPWLTSSFRSRYGIINYVIDSGRITLNSYNAFQESHVRLTVENLTHSVTSPQTRRDDYFYFYEGIVPFFCKQKCRDKGCWRSIFHHPCCAYNSEECEGPGIKPLLLKV